MSHTEATQKSRRALLIGLVTGWAGVLKDRPKAGAGWHRAATQITAGKGLVNVGQQRDGEEKDMLDSVGELLAGSPRLWSWVISSTWPCMAIMAITRVTHGVPGEGAFCGWGCYP
jgi:hypothetical protein